MCQAIIVITDFGKKYWLKFEKDFIGDIETMNSENKVKKINKIKDYHSAIKFGIDQDRFVVLISQAGRKKNISRTNSVLTTWCNSVAEIGIAAHQNGGTLDIKKLTPNNKTYHYKEFNNEVPDDPVWTEIQPLFDALLSKSIDGRLFDNLWSVLVPKPEEIAHKLRSEILTPFMPFYFYHESVKKNLDDKEWDSLLERAREEIGKKNERGEYILDEKMKNLLDLNDIGNESKKSKMKKLSELKSNLSKGQDSRDIIELFSKELEEVVDAIESGNVVNAKS